MMGERNDDRTEDEVADFMGRLKSRIAATEMARKAAMNGDPICGAYFAFLDGIRNSPEGAFIADHLDYFDDDDFGEERPY